jgi:hypothetical protein
VFSSVALGCATLLHNPWQVGHHSQFIENKWVIGSQRRASRGKAYTPCLSIRNYKAEPVTLLRVKTAWPPKLLMLFLLAFPFYAACAQETVFDVPSADILDKGKVYGELDGTARPVNPVATFTPRVMVGVGSNIEAGVNFDGPSTDTPFEQIISPTIKWRPWKNETSGWSFFLGDDLLFPATHRTYDAGNYAYAFFSKTWKNGTRLDLGGYDFTANVVANANRAGGQFSLERQISKRITLAVEWYTGSHASGYVNPGAIFKLASKLTLYTAYQIGNSGVSSGNHQFLWEIGHNFN